MPVVLDHEKIFEYYMCLPAEVREVVIDEMKPVERCRFIRCSKLSQKEARSSKKLIHSLEIFHRCENSITICVRYSKNDRHSFSLRFSAWTKKSIKYFSFDNEELWKTELSKSTELVQLSLQYFKNYLKIYQNTVPELTVEGFGEQLAHFNFEIDSLKRLERLHGDADIQHFYSKSRRPLKKLKICTREPENRFLLNGDKVYQVSRILFVPSLKLNNEQFLKLSASEIRIDIGELTVEDILRFIESWRNGEIRSNFKECEWNLVGSGFDVEQLFHRLCKTNTSQLNIAHPKEAGKFASLVYYGSMSLIFSVKN